MYASIDDLKPGNVFLVQSSWMVGGSEIFALIDRVIIVNQDIAPVIRFYDEPFNEISSHSFLAVQKKSQPLTLELLIALYDYIAITEQAKTIKLLKIQGD